MPNNDRFDSILLVAFGGPTSGSQGYEFVKGIVGNRPAAEPRIREVATHYEHLDGSPFNRLTFDQAQALKLALENRGVKVPIHCGMRHWSPWVKDVVSSMSAEGLKNTLSVIMAPHQCWISWDWYKDTVTEANSACGSRPLNVTYVDPWWTEPRFIQANADQIKSAFASLGDRAEGAQLVFTAHAIPINVCKLCQSGERQCPYTPQFEQSAKAIAGLLGRADRYLTCYQSQASHTTAWTGPGINDLLRDLAKKKVKDVVISPIGFLCDHVEVLYDLDVDARKTAGEVGIGYTRAQTVGSHPAFIELLADKVLERFEEKPRLEDPLRLS